MKKIFLIIVSLAILSCSTSTKDSDIQKSRIVDILQRIENAFMEADVPRIMEYYHKDFLHNGVSFISEEFFWYDQITLYSMLSIEVIDIKINADYATAYLKIFFFDQNNQYGPFFTPDNYGNIAYFYYDKGIWKLCGNQMLQ